jgi:hypothetical protein
VFDAFYQEKGVAGSDSHGFGLGLAIVKRLADVLGYQIRVSPCPARVRCSDWSSAGRTSSLDRRRQWVHGKMRRGESVLGLGPGTEQGSAQHSSWRRRLSPGRLGIDHSIAIASRERRRFQESGLNLFVASSIGTDPLVTSAAACATDIAGTEMGYCSASL